MNRRQMMTGAFLILALPLTIHAKQNDDKVSLNFVAIPLRQLLQILADMKSLNLVMSEKVTGKMTIHIKHAPWQEVLDTILASRSLLAQRKGSVLWVGPYDELMAHEKRLLEREQQADKVEQSHLALRQIMIEAKIVEAERRFAQNLGAKLGYQAKGAQAKSNLSAGGLHGFEASTGAIGLLGKQATEALNIELSALESNGLGNIVSNPRVLAAENSQALIEQGTELPYQSSAGNSGGTKVQFRKANLRLEVKPRIQKGDMIVLDVDINKDSVGLKTEQGFAIDTKHVKTQVLVESGGTVVLGGIFQEADRKDSTQVPFLGEIPILGVLFKQEAKFRDKTELLIFLTPTLVSSQKPQ